MNPRRRDVLAWGAIATSAAFGGWALIGGHPLPAVPALLLVPGEPVLVLHDGSPAADRFVAAMTSSYPRNAAIVHAVAVLARGGFDAVAALLAQNDRGSIVAVFDDAEALVVDTALRNCGVYAAVHRRFGRHVLLTAKL